MRIAAASLGSMEEHCDVDLRGATRIPAPHASSGAAVEEQQHLECNVSAIKAQVAKRASLESAAANTSVSPLTASSEYWEQTMLHAGTELRFTQEVHTRALE